jgi:hypothetical protein
MREHATPKPCLPVGWDPDALIEILGSCGA